jgi:hypothetical protein
MVAIKELSKLKKGMVLVQRRPDSDDVRWVVNGTQNKDATVQIKHGHFKTYIGKENNKQFQFVRDVDRTRVKKSQRK